MQSDSSDPPTTGIRQFLTDTFSDEELTTLCYDHFREVYEGFTSDMTKGQKLQLLIEHCQRREVTTRLLALVEKARPEQFQKRFSQLQQTQASPTLSGETPTRQEKLAPPESSEPSPRPQSVERPDVSRPLKVFLCHATDDKPAVRKLHQRLQADGFAPWLDEEDLLPGQDWQQEIPKQVRTSDVVIVCLSRKAVSKTGYVQKEIKYALDVADEQPEGTIFLIPLKLEECDTPERLRRWEWVNLVDENGYDKLLRALRARASTLGISGAPPKQIGKSRRLYLLGPLLLLLLVSVYTIWLRGKSDSPTIVPTGAKPVAVQPTLTQMPTVTLTFSATAAPSLGAVTNPEVLFLAKKCPKGVVNPSDPDQCSGTYTTSLSLDEGDVILVKFEIFNGYSRNNIENLSIRGGFDPRTIWGRVVADNIVPDDQWISVTMENGLGFQTVANSTQVLNFSYAENRWSEPVHLPDDAAGYSPFFFPKGDSGVYYVGAFPWYNGKAFYFALRVTRLSPVFDTDLFRVGLVDKEGSALNYSTQITVTEGDRLRFLLYLHNNTVGTIAQNVRIETSGFPAYFSSSFVVTGSVMADNASPKSTSNSIRIAPSSQGKTLKLTYIPNSTGVYGWPNLRAGRHSGTRLPDGIVNSQLVLLKLHH